jgi:hypothetical protein
MPWDVLFGLCCLPILVAAWVRLRPLAWLAAGTIALLARPTSWRSKTPPGSGRCWHSAGCNFVAIYLWIKAARVWYWPMPDRSRRQTSQSHRPSATRSHRHSAARPMWPSARPAPSSY